MGHASNDEPLSNGVGYPLAHFLPESGGVGFCHAVVIRMNVYRTLNPLSLNLGRL